MQDLIDATEALARTFPAFDELEHIAGFNERIEEIHEAPDEWELLVALLRAWPPELYSQLLDRVERAPPVAAALARIDEDGVAAVLAGVASTPTALLESLG